MKDFLFSVKIEYQSHAKEWSKQAIEELAINR